MTDNRPIAWGIVGCGDVVTKKWVPSLLAVPNSRVVGVFDLEREAAESVAAKVAGKIYDSYEEMLDDGEVEIIYLATPHHLHCPLSLKALRARKHVLCEKPMGVSAEQAREMVKTADQNGRNLFVDYYRRFHPIIQRARKSLEQGEIGEITFVEFRSTYPMDWLNPWGAAWMWDRAKAGGGPIMNLGVHRIDILHYLAGPVRRVAGCVEHLGGDRVEKWISGVMEFASGASGIVVMHADAQPPCDLLAVHGRKGTVTFDPFDKRLVIQRGKEQKEETFSPPIPLHTGILEHIAAVLRGKAKNNVVSGKEGLRTIELATFLHGGGP
jgi:predicted dehydrogenase